LVAGLALVQVVMSASMDSVATSVINLVEPLFGVEPARLAAPMKPWLPLAVVLFVWKREQRVGLGACAVALAFATLSYLRGVIAEQLLESGSQDTALGFIDWTNWLLSALMPVGVAVAWGIARRQGTRWWPGLVVAAALAVLARWLDIDPLRDGDQQLRAALAAVIYQVVPAVAGGLACWWLDVRGRSR
jgi:hypothetical protein